METFKDSTGGPGALLGASHIDNTGVSLLSFHCEPCGGVFLLSGSSLIHPLWLRYAGGGCSVWVLTHEEYTNTKKDLERSLRMDKHWKREGKEEVWWRQPCAWERLRQKEKGATEDKMVGRHHWLSGHESKQTLGDSEGQGSLAYCSPLGHKESDMTEGLNNNNQVLFS